MSKWYALTPTGYKQVKQPVAIHDHWHYNEKEDAYYEDSPYDMLKKGKKNEDRKNS